MSARYGMFWLMWGWMPYLVMGGDFDAWDGLV